MLKDEERQQEMLKMKMEQRRARRRKMQDKLSTVQEEIRNNEAETQEKKEVALVEI
jgi:DNA-binding protein YbaB